jgi:hypothetical protein
VVLRFDALALIKIRFLARLALWLERWSYFAQVEFPLNKRTAYELAMMKLGHWGPLEVAIPTTGRFASHFDLRHSFLIRQHVPAFSLRRRIQNLV